MKPIIKYIKKKISDFKKIHNRVPIFSYNIGNLRYKCFGLKECESILNNKKVLNIVLEIKNAEKRKMLFNIKLDIINFNEKYAVGEEGAGFKEINDMGNLFVKWLNRHKDLYIKIFPYGDLPAKRMRIYDRVLKQAGYNIMYIKKHGHREINLYRYIHSLYNLLF